MYKLIYNNKVIDVIKFPTFLYFLPNGHIAVTDKSSATGIMGSDNETIYSFIQTSLPNIKIVKAEEINTDEFSRLFSLLNSGDDVADTEDIILEKARKARIEYLSTVCKNKIFAGFNIELKDGNEYNFRLTSEDQLNLLAIENQFNNGDQKFIYHATDEPCKVFDRDDMYRILSSAKKLITFHTTYFNTAKQYLNTLDTIVKINMFTYGDDITDFIKDASIKQVIRNGVD